VIDLEKVGERLKQAQESFGEARDKLSRNKGNVIRQAEMLKNLGVKPTKSLPHAVLEASLDEVSSLQTAIEDSPQSDLSTIGVIKFDPTAEGQD
jgi:DNA recombination protein RmuC